jgi:hypothetical protein
LGKIIYESDPLRPLHSVNGIVCLKNQAYQDHASVGQIASAAGVCRPRAGARNAKGMLLGVILKLHAPPPGPVP